MRIHTISSLNTSSSPDQLLPWSAGLRRRWRDRACPNMRGCWSFSWRAYSLYTSDRATLRRRVCMWITLAIRTSLSVISITRDYRAMAIVSLILGSILDVLDFFFIAWCLARIGEAEGRRKVLGIMIGRWHFDTFLLLCALIHIGLIAGNFVGLTAMGLGSSWVALWLAIFGVTWITVWDPEQDVYV